MRQAQGLCSVLVLTRGAWEQGCPGIVYCALVLTRGAWNEASPGLVLHTGAHRSHLANLELLLSSLLERLLVLSRGPWNECSLGLVLQTGAHRFNSANLELLVSPLLERHIFKFCQTEMISLECHHHIHSSSTSTLYPYMVHPNKECLYTGCHYRG